MFLLSRILLLCQVRAAETGLSLLEALRYEWLQELLTLLGLLHRSNGALRLLVDSIPLECALFVTPGELLLVAQAFGLSTADNVPAHAALHIWL